MAVYRLRFGYLKFADDGHTRQLDEKAIVLVNGFDGSLCTIDVLLHKTQTALRQCIHRAPLRHSVTMTSDLLIMTLATCWKGKALLQVTCSNPEHVRLSSYDYPFTG